jgi:hypothetical protein
LNNMTIPADLSSRVAALATISPPARRIQALGLLVAMTRTKLPVRASTVKLWQELGYQLDRCGIELRIACDPLDRDAMFTGHARAAYRIAQAMLEQIAARRPGATQRLPQSWQPRGQVIEIAEVA